jgi:4-amino-4-deoxy-L-arabinose transferase-like glycosyltransferase
MPGPNVRWLSLALLTAVVATVGAVLDARFGWITPVFVAFAHQFYEVPLLAAIRRPSQLVLVRWHLGIASLLLTLGLLTAPFVSRHGRNWFAIFLLGYAIRAGIWICGGNLPLVPGDSCHYLEVATSVLRGEGPVKHYVESYFADYPQIREGRGVLDDWATPLDAYVRAATFRLAGLRPTSSVEARLVAAKACSFAVNLLCLPALYVFARRRYGCRVSIWTLAAIAVLPVHALYAGFVLRESLVALTSILAIWTLTEVFHADPEKRAIWCWAAAAGLCGGLAVLARTTALALLAGAGLFALVVHVRKRFGPLLLWIIAAGLVCLPWAWATFQEHGSPFFSYTSYFEFNFSWTIHHYQKGNTLPSQFYTLANLPEIIRVKIKSLLLIAVYSTMIVGLPIVAGFGWRLGRVKGPGRDTDRLIGTIFAVFVLATLKITADVTQVAQLGRYYLPVFALALPGGIAGILEWLDSSGSKRRIGLAVVATWCTLVWADPSWAYDATWLTKRFQLHWPALNEAGAWIRSHPDRVPAEARIMTWFPWELRVTSDRTTILMPRNFSAKRINEVIAQYGVTHFLWGSFEPPPYYEINPESWALELDQLRAALGLTDSREVFRTSKDIFFPVRLYRLR